MDKNIPTLDTVRKITKNNIINKLTFRGYKNFKNKNLLKKYHF